MTGTPRAGARIAVGEERPPARAEAGRELASEPSFVRRAANRFAVEWNFWVNILYDARRFRRHAWLHSVRSGESRAARMMADAHFLEYGMALTRSRPGFGFARARRLAADLIRGGTSPAATEVALRTLEAWVEFNAGADFPEPVVEALETCRATRNGLDGGVEAVSGSAIREAAEVDFLRFVRARHSVRSFAPGPVPDEAIRRAVAAAQEAPSSCNRQTSHARVWTQPDMIEKVRKHQAGNRTFGHELAGIIMVTSDLRHWEHAGERYQAWVDGGLFAMTLAYALHAEGLGTCMLNWSVDRTVDRGLRRLIGIGDEHLVIVLMGFGHLPEELKVCRSQRLPLDTALTLNPPLEASEL